MKGLQNLLRSVFISPELAVAGVLVFAWWVHPPPFALVDIAIQRLDWIPLLTPFSALILFAAGICWKILFPAKNGTALCRWPRYPQLRTTTVVGLVFVVTGAVAGVAGALSRGEMPEGLPSLLLISGYAVSGIATLTMLNAALTVRSLASYGH